ncbi:hypothetical protein Vadar_013888 [Vaccinium darrowii]|uniref:Uncharacterized protein n=1 Tax=Vaccinium darrowii TaxID=229202 RepID=A0ACB7Z437_9ERIC|nr:hypothetical protein Vadar_013888 [Vaccinium darrowii]
MRRSQKPEDFTVPPKWIPFQSTVAFRTFEINRIFDDDVKGNDENVPAKHRLGVSIDGSDVVAVRSSYEFEPEWLQVLEEIYGKPVIPVGILPPMPIDQDSDDDDKEWKSIKEWLDKQPKGSVVYVAFGSEARPSQTELTEIALGLEQTRFQYFWALRKKSALADSEVVKLPNGFEERTKERGIVCTSWAPQLKILSHDSVGGFLTHSGWSSLVEAIKFEKPLILLTFLADQGLNARLFEEKKMGYSIPVADSVRLVMVEEKGKVYRDKIREVKGLLVDGEIQDKYVNNLLNYFTMHKRRAQKTK